MLKAVSEVIRPLHNLYLEVLCRRSGLIRKLYKNMAKHSHSVGSTPNTESVNKWKIPHYYRRSPSISSQNSGVNEAGVGSTPSTPNINVMTSPKRVLMEDPKKNRKKSGTRGRKNGKKKAGEMVFVNYTVQDSASESEGISSSNSATPVDTPVLTPSETINRKKKSSRSRMLKIFGSSRESSDKYATQNINPGDSPCIEETLPLSKNSGPTTKRSYSSFLKYGKFCGSSAENLPMQAAPSSSSSHSYTEEEVVPKSDHNPTSVTPFVQANSEMFTAPPRGIHLLNRKKAYSELDVTHYTKKGLGNNDAPTDHRLAEKNDQVEVPSSTFYTNRKTMSSEPSLTGSKLGDENDASVAFTKMFTRKRANTGGSMSSLISLNHNSQQSNIQPQANNNFMTGSFKKNLSVSSISSTSNRYSPIRTASPGRPRSATRGSSIHRISRDSSSLQNMFEVADPITGSASESFLDTQVGNKNGSIRHKRKQESVSDSIRTSGNSNSIAPSPSLATPPAFTSGYTVMSSTSASSTPSMLEPSNASQMSNSAQSGGNGYEYTNYSNVLDEDSPPEVMLIQDADVRTPADSLPALKGIPRTTIEEIEEEPETNDYYLQVRHNNDSLDRMLANGESTESSQVDSLLTNSVFSLANNNIWPQQWQDQGSYTVSFNGSNVNSGRSEDLEKSISFSGSKKPSPCINTDTLEINSAGDDKLMKKPDDSDLQMHIGFDFENSNSFFQEQQNKTSNDNNINYDRSALSSTPVDEQASAVTSIANISPGTGASLSAEDFTNTTSYHRNTREQLNLTNSSMMPSNSLTSQTNMNSNMNPNTGAWKMMNKDLEAIADSCFFNEDPNEISYS